MKYLYMLSIYILLVTHNWKIIIGAQMILPQVIFFSDCDSIMLVYGLTSLDRHSILSSGRLVVMNFLENIFLKLKKDIILRTVGRNSIFH